MPMSMGMGKGRNKVSYEEALPQGQNPIFIHLLLGPSQKLPWIEIRQLLVQHIL